MSNKILYRIIVETFSGTYELPDVDLEKCKDQLTPTQFGNPCLQIVNEELSILSIPWNRVHSVTAWPYVLVSTGRLNSSARPEVLWQCDA